jgi:hypothetical protein
MERLGVTLTHWCIVEQLETPNTKASNSAPDHVFHIDDVIEDIDGCTWVLEQSVLQLGTPSVDMTTVDCVIKQIVLYMDKRERHKSYPKFTACGLPGHSIDQFHPLVNYCIAHALSQSGKALVTFHEHSCMDDLSDSPLPWNLLQPRLMTHFLLFIRIAKTTLMESPILNPTSRSWWIPVPL